ncbi:MAG: CopD family protein [Gammaproteobacteria bacterium]|nr:CopD family protein [Gammaproteobacteria bacterium]
MLWVRAFHIIFMVSWFAGLFYLPRLFVYHALCDDATGQARFVIMERKLFWFITPWAVLTVFFGLWLLWDYAWAAYSHTVWLHAKLLLVALLIAYHIYCGKLMLDFKYGRNRRNHVFYRWLNEAPVLLLFAIVVLAVVKPL